MPKSVKITMCGHCKKCGHRWATNKWDFQMRLAYCKCRSKHMELRIRCPKCGEQYLLRRDTHSY